MVPKANKQTKNLQVSDQYLFFPASFPLLHMVVPYLTICHTHTHLYFVSSLLVPSSFVYTDTCLSLSQLVSHSYTHAGSVPLPLSFLMSSSVYFSFCWLSASSVKSAFTEADSRLKNSISAGFCIQVAALVVPPAE